jgi:hypothetical protein
MVYDNYSTNNLIQLFAGYLLFKFHKYALYMMPLPNPSLL